jgi:ubiquinone/menaquinone biosynthesis C-methylase UbiE
MSDNDLQSALHSMRDDWDSRARENARHYIATLRDEWDDETFFASGEQELANQVLNDMGNICQGREPGSMRVLEIGCGAARVTRALARVFGEVHAVDISSEMIARARAALSTQPNAFVYLGNGMDLSVIPNVPFDFVFSRYVFQHIPILNIIENYFKEVARLLRPGALFKVQVQGRPVQDSVPPGNAVATMPEPTPELPFFWKLTGRIPLAVRKKLLRPLRGLLTREAAEAPTDVTASSVLPINTWVGAMLTPQNTKNLCDESGFELRYQRGAGEVEYWLWCFKK